jgi:hypothetical protein
MTRNNDLTSVDCRLRAAGRDLREQVSASVDVNERLREITSPPPSRWGWLRAGAIAATAVAGVLVLAIVVGPLTDVTVEPPPGLTEEPPPDQGPAPDDCSAAHLDPGVVADPDLPAAVSDRRQQIMEAAGACDYARLAELTGPDFTYSFGGGDDPAGYWQMREREGDPVLAHLVQLLTMASGEVTIEDDTIVVWPRAHALDTPAHRTELEEEFGPDRVARWFEPGEYWGPRVGVRSDGTWLFYVDGD